MAEIIARQLETEFPAIQRVALHPSQDVTVLRRVLQMHMSQFLSSPFESAEVGQVLDQLERDLEVRPATIDSTDRFFAFTRSQAPPSPPIPLGIQPDGEPLHAPPPTLRHPHGRSQYVAQPYQNGAQHRFVASSRVPQAPGTAPDYKSPSSSNMRGAITTWSAPTFPTPLMKPRSPCCARPIRSCW